MLIVDDREHGGIAELVAQLGVEVSVQRLEYGDCCFTGNGEQGECLVGCERKKLSDLVNSMKDRRLSGHQLRGMWQSYDYCLLFAEGVWRPGAGGEIEELRGRDWRPFYSHQAGKAAISYRQLLSYLTTLELRGGLVVRRTSNERETAAQYVSLYHWFTDKDWHQHNSHDQVYANGVPKKGHGSGWAREHGHDTTFAAGARGRTGKVLQADPTTAWRVAMQFPGIDRRAEKVAAHFGSVRAMALATEKEWASIDGIGKVTAKAVVRAIAEEGA
jgi:ERCC4-type nuclease